MPQYCFPLEPVKRLKHTKGANQYAGRGLDAQRAAAPALAERPVLEGPLAAHHVPDAGPRGRLDAAERGHGRPDLLACLAAARAEMAIAARTRHAVEIRGAQRIERGRVEDRAEILPGLAHRGRDTAPPLHHQERVGGAIGPRQTPFLVRDGRRQPLHLAPGPALRRWCRDVLAPCPLQPAPRHLALPRCVASFSRPAESVSRVPGSGGAWSSKARRSPTSSGSGSGTALSRRYASSGGGSGVASASSMSAATRARPSTLSRGTMQSGSCRAQ